jgi:hypothetical protein
MSTRMEFDYCHDIKLINNESLSFDIDVKGTLLKYNKKIYLTIPHVGLDVKMIIFNNNKYNHFKYSEWSENIIVEINENDIHEHQYIFKKFGLECINVSKKFKLNNYYCNYIKNDYFSVNMMINNPELMFYTMRSEEKGSPNTGTPLHYNGVLYGIFSRYNSEKDFCYIIPHLFIQKSIENKTNYLFKCTNLKSIKKIKKNYAHDDMIYCPQIRYNISIECYLLFLSNSTNHTLINDTSDIYLKFKKINKSITSNTFLLHWCKMFNKEILFEILEKYDSRDKTHKFEIRGEQHIFVYN